MISLVDYINEQRVDEGIIGDIIRRTLDAVFNGIGKIFDTGFKWAENGREDIKGIFAASASVNRNWFKQDRAARNRHENFIKNVSQAKNFDGVQQEGIKSIDEINQLIDRAKEQLNQATDDSKRNSLQKQIDLWGQEKRAFAYEIELFAKSQNEKLNQEFINLCEQLKKEDPIGWKNELNKLIAEQEKNAKQENNTQQNNEDNK